ncbi:LLM class flavin-dependent oxidoreductase [Mucilaginibacter daejeonensis]|uniref:LLM class flavin-dependent oxidoreductase n=1 Tax=Mucilaginibacter daejeonensis TaxID=398049 RepID=UPI001D178AA7|nr:LLM class flavin-dependent oxidoreductase [Mucilaginibacter daejeonensis]UEG54843.1 LLM class flavin-dependent oxidoreductase [Mucilaginibacter daejeonensis]
MKKDKVAYSILELALVAQGGTFNETLKNSLALAKEAEALGYSRFWFAEHHNSAYVGSNAPTLLIGYVADNTRTIKVGSGGVMLPNHSPLVVAEQFGTLAHLYPGRIEMGLGRAPGTDGETAQAIRSDFMRAAHSFPQEIEKIERYFAKENANAKVRAAIAEGVEVPIYILGSSTDSAHLAAQKGLPYAFASHFASTHLLNALDIYRREFQPSETLERPYIIAGVNVIVAESDEQAERLFTTLINMFVGILTGRSQGLQPPTEMTDDFREMLAHPTVHQMLKYSFVGSKDTVKAKIKAFLDETEADELIMACNTYDFEDRLRSTRLFAQIIEELNQA